MGGGDNRTRAAGRSTKKVAGPKKTTARAKNVAPDDAKLGAEPKTTNAAEPDQMARTTRSVFSVLELKPGDLVEIKIVDAWWLARVETPLPNLTVDLFSTTVSLLLPPFWQFLNTSRLNSRMRP